MYLCVKNNLFGEYMHRFYDFQPSWLKGLDDKS